MKTLYGLILLLACALSLPVVADTSNGEGVEMHSNAVRSMETAWTNLVVLLPTGELRSIHDQILLLAASREAAGISSVETYSTALLREADNRRQKGDNEAAIYLTRKALELSPSSPRVLFNSLSLVGDLQIEATWSVALRALLLLPRDPSLLSQVMLHGLYPAAWAMTLGAYVVFVIFCFFWLVEILRSVAHIFPVSVRGIAAPVVTFLLLAVPMLFGPVVCLLVWGLFLWLTDRRRVWPPLLVGVVVAVWGLVIPLRERGAAWLEQPGTRALLGYSSGGFGALARYELEQLARSKPDSAVVWFSYGQLLRRWGDYGGALVALDRAVQLSNGAPYILAERAVARALLQDRAGASADLKQAEIGGVKSAEFLFNYSKIVFDDDLDTGLVRDYLSRAAAADSRAMEFLRNRELSLGGKHPSTFADVRAPLGQVFQTMWDPEVTPQTALKATALLPGASSMLLSAIGIMYCLLPILPRTKKTRRRLSPYYAEYEPSSFALMITKVIPGAAFVIADRPMVAFFPLALLAFLSMPLIGWPGEMQWLEMLPTMWMGAYVVGFAVLCLGWGLLSAALAEE